MAPPRRTNRPPPRRLPPAHRPAHSQMGRRTRHPRPAPPQHCRSRPHHPRFPPRIPPPPPPAPAPAPPPPRPDRLPQLPRPAETRQNETKPKCTRHNHLTHQRLATTRTRPVSFCHRRKPYLRNGELRRAPNSVTPLSSI